MNEEYKIDGRPATIFRIAKTKENPYVMIDKRIIDNKDLSFKAKGILTYLLSRPNGWEVNLEDLSNRGTDGLAAVKSGVKELKDAGYLRHSGIRKASGQFDTVIWEVYEAPQVGNQLTDTPTGGVSPQVDFQSPQVDYPQVGNPQVGNPQVDNRTQVVLSTLSNNDLNSNDLSIKRTRANIFGIEASILQDRPTVIGDLQVVKRGWADGIPEPELELLRVFTQVTGIFPEKSDKDTWCGEAHRWLSLTPPAQVRDIEEAYRRAKPDNGKGYHVYHPRSLTGGIKEAIGERIRGATKPKTPHDKLEEA
jgi:hypothetical protein